MNRVRLYRTRERRWAAACIILCLLFLLACCGVIGFAMARMAWPAIGCGGIIPLLWAAWMRCIANCTYWSQRKYAEILFLDREVQPRSPALSCPRCGRHYYSSEPEAYCDACLVEKAAAKSRGEA